MAKQKKLGPNPSAAYGDPLSLGCNQCVFKEPCGGIYESFGCFEECCKKPEICKVGCSFSHGFARMYQEAGGFYPTISVFRQETSESLPRYIPQVHHRYSRGGANDESLVALPTHHVVGLLRRRPNLTSDELREYFLVAPSARVILISVAKDHHLEPIWRDIHSSEIPSSLARLSIEHITAPNFSVPLDLPRTEGLINISRIVKSCEYFSKAGLSVIPHLNAWHERQWKYWTGFLREHNQIRLVAKEFQTGMAIRKNAIWQINRLREMEQRLGRPIHLIAVAGRRYIQELLCLRNFSIVDSQPFFQTLHRQSLTFPNGKWVLQRMPRGKHLDSLLSRNIAAYRQGIEEKCAIAMRIHRPLHAISRLADASAKPIQIKTAQLDLFPAIEWKKIA